MMLSPSYMCDLFVVPTNRPVQGLGVVYPVGAEVPLLRNQEPKQRTSTSRIGPAPSRVRPIRILFLTNAHNGMSQALYLNLTEKGHQVSDTSVISVRKHAQYIIYA